MPSDRLTPAQLRFRAWVKREIARWSSLDNTTHTLLMDEAESLEEEAARREAEGKPQSAATGHYENDCEELGRTGVGQDSARPLPQGECEGPGSAAAPDGYAVGPMTMKRPVGSNADDWAVFIEYWCGPIKALSFLAVQIAEAIDDAGKDKPAPADDLVKRLGYLEKERARWRMEWRSELRTRRASEARVRELERECGQWQEASGQANVRAEQLEDKWEAEKARADKAEARVRELEAELAAERDSRQIAQATCDMQKARADGLAAAIDRAVEELDAIEKAASANDPWDELQVRAADTAKKLRMAAALTEGGA